MKPFFNSIQTPLQCRSILREFYSRCSLIAHALAQSFFNHVMTPLKISSLRDALQIFPDGLIASQMKVIKSSLLVSVKEAWTNKRLRVGLMVGLVALPSWRGHLFFNMEERIPDFYYVNYAFYFNTIRAYVCGIFLVTGFFIAAPQKWAFRWWALPVFILCATEIWCESFYNHWTDFYKEMPDWQVWAVVIFCAPAFFFSMNYLVYRKYHLKDGNAARIIGIAKSPGLTWEEKGVNLDKLVKESEQYNSRI